MASFIENLNEKYSELGLHVCFDGYYTNNKEVHVQISYSAGVLSVSDDYQDYKVDLDRNFGVIAQDIIKKVGRYINKTVKPLERKKCNNLTDYQVSAPVVDIIHTNDGKIIAEDLIQFNQLGLQKLFCTGWAADLIPKGACTMSNSIGSPSFGAIPTEARRNFIALNFFDTKDDIARLLDPEDYCGPEGGDVGIDLQIVKGFDIGKWVLYYWDAHYLCLYDYCCEIRFKQHQSITIMLHMVLDDNEWQIAAVAVGKDTAAARYNLQACIEGQYEELNELPNKVVFYDPDDSIWQKDSYDIWYWKDNMYDQNTRFWENVDDVLL